MHLDALREAMKAKTAVSCPTAIQSPRGLNLFVVASVAKHFRGHVRRGHPATGHMGWGNYWRRLQVSQTFVLHCIGTLLKDYRGGRYIAHKTPNLDWTCALTVKSREIWKEWRMRVLGSYLPQV
jgi:hypothetical protein